MDSKGALGWKLEEGERRGRPGQGVEQETRMEWRSWDLRKRLRLLGLSNELAQMSQARLLDRRKYLVGLRPAFPNPAWKPRGALSS